MVPETSGSLSHRFAVTINSSDDDDDSRSSYELDNEPRHSRKNGSTCDGLTGLLSELSLSKDESITPAGQDTIPALQRNPRLITQQSMLLDTQDLSDLIGDLHTTLQPKPRVDPRALNNSGQKQLDNPLERMVELLREKKKLKNFTDVTKELAIRGRNVLHYMAAEPDFSAYEKTLKKHVVSKRFERLLTQRTDDEGESPLHAICLNQNAPMLRFLLKCKNIDVPDLLRKSGLIKTKTTQCNAFLCLARSFTDNQIEQTYNKAMLDLLIELYEEKPAITFLRDSKDSEGRTFMALTHQSGDEGLIEKVSLLMTKNWV